jgi:hypothetical protein
MQAGGLLDFAANSHVHLGCTSIDLRTPTGASAQPLKSIPQSERKKPRSFSIAKKQSASFAHSRQFPPTNQSTGRAAETPNFVIT